MNQNISEISEIIDLFITESINSETIYTPTKNGEVQSWSRDESAKPSVIVFAKQEDAELFAKNHGDDFEVTTISLFDFLYLWLPDMFDKMTLAGIFGKGVVTEVETEMIQARYTELLPEHIETQYEEKRASNPEYSYVCIGLFPNSDAKALLKEFDKEGIRYDDGVDESQIKGMNATLSYMGGTCGLGIEIIITVHEDDLEKADEIQKRVFSTEI